MQEARPILEGLAEATGETAHLGILSGDEVVHLDGVLPDQRVLCATRVGERADAHCTALGKALLAGRIDDRGAFETAGSSEGAGSERAAAPSWSASVPTGLQRPPQDGKLARHTSATVEDASKLAEELRTVGLRGYSTDLEEYSHGLHCVAAAVRDNSARVVAALSLSGPSFRLGEAELHGSAARAISEAALQLSISLGATL
jgi:DNA-binding IclR family transcriptional regulator